MSLIKEFKEFAVKGNMIDLAVGIIIGAAFGRIISSLVADVLMPPLGLLLGGVDFSNMAVLLREGATTDQSVWLRYGKFIQAIIDFVLVAAAIFLMVKGINRLKREEAPAAPPPPPVEVALLTEIRDLLKVRA